MKKYEIQEMKIGYRVNENMNTGNKSMKPWK